MKHLIIIPIVLFSWHLFAQVGIGTNTPHNSSMLEVNATDKGILFPRMTSSQRMNIASPAKGLHVFDTNTNSLWYYNGSFWVNSKSEASEGDVKSGIQTTDHSGWILLDGRPLTNLSTNQQAAAAALGITGNLPNATNAYLVQNGANMGAVSGSNTTSLTQANLPNVSFTGTAANAGAHSHTTDPAAVSSNYNGDHNHWTDPSAVYSSTDGYHNHTGSVSGSGWNAGGTFVGGFDAGPFVLTTQILTVDAAGSHAHVVDIPGTYSTTNGGHTHSIDVPSTTSSTATDHSHAVSVASGGSATPINIAPRSLSVNMFIYLGL
ncbi:MAG: hypothetical protein RIR94_1544 [Bacteroidota bacterium]|jgi:microcystin-dependent protein